jgi:hypothetical protein
MRHLGAPLPNVVSLRRLEPLGSRPVEDGRDHVDDFNSSLKLPMGEALIKSPPRLRVTRAQNADFISRRSSRLEDKPHAGRPEVQARTCC